MIAEIPFGIVAVHIEFAERRSAVTYGYQNQFLVSSRHFFGHDPVGARLSTGRFATVVRGLP